MALLACIRCGVSDGDGRDRHFLTIRSERGIEGKLERRGRQNEGGDDDGIVA
jgi:hypothetical protein